MTTLLALKNRKAVLRNCMEIERVADGEASVETRIDYELILAKLRIADTQLLTKPDKCTQCKWLHE